MIERLARTSYRRRWVVLGTWVVALIAISVVAGVAGGELRNNFNLPGAESQDASDLLEEGGFGGQSGETGQIVVTSADGVEDGSPARSTLDDFTAQINEEVPEVEIVPPEADNDQISPDGTIGYAEVQFGDRDFDAANELADEIVKVRNNVEAPEGVELELGGGLFIEEPEFSSEAVGFAAAIIILLIAFGSVLAMGLPLVTAIFGIGAGMAIVQLMAHIFDVPDFGPQAVSMIAIGVGIDYALLIVTRFRDQLAEGSEPEEAVVRALATAGRSVLFAGTTVVIAMLGLLTFPVALTQALAIAISSGVLLVMLGSLTLLPALLGFCGRNIDKLSIHRKGHVPSTGEASMWYRWSRVVQRRPWPAALVGLVVLLALAAPVFSMRLGFGDTGNRPETDTTRRAYDLLEEGFGPGYNGPFFLALDLPGDAAEDEAVIGRLSGELDDTDGLVDQRVGPFVNDGGDVGFMQVFPTTSPQDKDTDNTVNRIRDNAVPAAIEGTDAEVLVGGASAGAVDFAEFQSSRLPLFIGVVLLLSFVLLMMVFRSILVPLKAAVMNMLSIGAAYGVVVAIFQWGWLHEQLGLGEPGPIEAWAPMMLFAIVFGLSMDYEVFLLSRIREEYDRTGVNATAVADGLARTARVITAAAAIMICVFGAFMLSSDRSLQMFGAGLAFAVLVDATVVRLLLVPATMELLGDRNWWIPRWLDRRLPRLHVDATPRPPTTEPTAREHV